ncbi:MAG: hypothetical protein V1869_01010 [Candidatus Omnitrophota bacterium]
MKNKKGLIPAFITVRSASSRLPSKCLLPFGDGNVLEHVIRRVKFFGLEAVVCTTSEPGDDIIAQIARRERVECFRGSSEDKLRRWLDCCDSLGFDKFHTIDADDPFFDPILVKKSFSLLNRGYDLVYPTKSSSLGAASVGFSLTRGIVFLACEIKKTKKTEMAWVFLERVPGIRAKRLEEECPGKPKSRLTLDYEEDYWLLRTVQRLLGNNASRRRVDDLFARNPDLYKVNWFRNSQWKKRQAFLSRVRK